MTAYRDGMATPQPVTVNVDGRTIWLSGRDADMTASQARRLAADLTAAADTLDARR